MENLEYLPRFPVFTSETVIPGLWIAAVAIVHVFLAQFAVGGGLLVAVFEWRAERRGEPALREFCERYFTTLVLISFVLGAVTGVGIWLTVALAAPRALLLLLAEFHWIWAAEWAFFVLEVVAGYAYYRHRRTLSFRARMFLVGAYAVAAWMSLFWINGILSFQLTPGPGPGGDLLAMFFNAAFWPTLIGRTVAAAATAALVACVVVRTAERHGSDGGEVVRGAAPFFLPLLVMPGVALWFFLAVPETARQYALGESVAMTMFFALAAGSSLLVAGYVAVSLFRQQALINLPVSALLLFLAFFATVGTEFVREGIRKPWVVHGALYSNGETPLSPAEAALGRSVLAADPWPLRDVERYPEGSVRDGRRVYRALCSACHTADGRVNALLGLTRAWSLDMLEINLSQLHKLKPFMPPFTGTAAERRALIDYLVWLRGEESP